MEKLTRIFAVGLILTVCAVPAGLYAGDQKEAERKIAELNKKIQEAGNGEDLQGAIDAAEEALDVAVDAYGEESPETAKAMNNTANLYMMAHHPVEAGNLYGQALEILEAKKGKNDLDAADYNYNLAMSLAMQGKYDDARKAMKRTIEIRKKKLGKKHADTVKAEEMLQEIG